MNRFSALLVEDEDQVCKPIQAPIQTPIPQTPQTPTQTKTPTKAPNAPIRMPYGWKPQAASPPAKMLIDDFPTLVSTKPKTGQSVGAWGNGVKSIRDAKDLPAPKPKISEQEQRRQRNAAARALFNSTGFIEAEDVTYLITDGCVRVIQDQDQEDDEDGMDYCEDMQEECDEWNM